MATPLSDVAVAMAAPVAVTVVLAPASVLKGSSVLVPVAELVPTSAPVVAGGPALGVSDVARELEAMVVAVDVTVLFSMPTMDRTQLAASSVNFWK